MKVLVVQSLKNKKRKEGSNVRKGAARKDPKQGTYGRDVRKGCREET